MSVRIIPIDQQGRGAFNGGQIVENKPVGFPSDGGFVRPFSNLFYWARAEAVVDSTIGQHPHQGFEIISFVLEGSIKHFDTKNNAWIPLREGDVQVIRAGNGIEHAEHLNKGAVIFQIWFDPDLSKTLSKPASYDDYKAETFISEEINGIGTITEYAGQSGGIELDSEIQVRRMKLLKSYDYPISKGTVLAAYAIDGHVRINDQSVNQDDFMILENEDIMRIEVVDPVDLFILELPASLSYRTYSQRFMRG